MSSVSIGIDDADVASINGVQAATVVTQPSDSGYSSSTRSRTKSVSRSSSSTASSTLLNSKFDRLTHSMNDVVDGTNGSESAGASLGIRRITIHPTLVQPGKRKREDEIDEGRRQIEKWDHDHPSRRARSESGGPGGSLGSIGRGFEMLKVCARAQEDEEQLDCAEDESDNYVMLRKETLPSGKVRTVARDRRLIGRVSSNERSSVMNLPSFVTSAQAQLPTRSLSSPPAWLVPHLTPASSGFSAYYRTSTSTRSRSPEQDRFQYHSLTPPPRAHTRPFGMDGSAEYTQPLYAPPTPSIYEHQMEQERWNVDTGFNANSSLPPQGHPELHFDSLPVSNRDLRSDTQLERPNAPGVSSIRDQFYFGCDDHFSPLTGAAVSPPANWSSPRAENYASDLPDLTLLTDQRSLTNFWTRNRTTPQSPIIVRPIPLDPYAVRLLNAAKSSAISSPPLDWVPPYSYRPTTPVTQLAHRRPTYASPPSLVHSENIQESLFESLAFPSNSLATPESNPAPVMIPRRRVRFAPESDKGPQRVSPSPPAPIQFYVDSDDSLLSELGVVSEKRIEYGKQEDRENYVPSFDTQTLSVDQARASLREPDDDDDSEHLFEILTDPIQDFHDDDD